MSKVQNITISAINALCRAWCELFTEPIRHWTPASGGVTSRDVERAVGWSQIPGTDKHDVDERPDTEAAQAEQLANASLPVA